MTPSGVVMARRPLKPAPSGGLPPTPSGTAVLWASADQGTFTDTIAGTPATTTGATVAAWQDLTGLAHHLTGSGGQMQAGTAPNSHNFVRFAGTSQYLQSLFTIDVPFDLFLMLEQRTWVEGVSIASSPTGSSFTAYQHAATPQIVIFNGASSGGNNSNLALNTWGLLEVGCPNSSPNAYLKVNNLTATTAGAMTTLGGSGRGGLMLAASSGPSAFGNIDVAEVILYSGILNSTDQTAIRTYFTGRYGIP